MTRNVVTRRQALALARERQRQLDADRVARIEQATARVLVSMDTRMAALADVRDAEDDAGRALEELLTLGTIEQVVQLVGVDAPEIRRLVREMKGREPAPDAAPRAAAVPTRPAVASADGTVSEDPLPDGQRL